MGDAVLHPLWRIVADPRCRPWVTRTRGSGPAKCARAEPVLSRLTLRRNLSANLIGKAVTGVLGFVFIPVYIRFLGIESYGLVGLFATITALGFAADFGLSATASRELSRLSVQPGSGQAMRDLIRTLEAGCWVIAALLGAVIMFGAPFIMNAWVQPNGLSSQTVHDAVLEMGVALALQWPVNFYANAMIGLQHQVALNVINVGMAAIRGIGAVIVLWGISPTIEAFFAWQVVVSGCHVLCASQQMWRGLPSAPARARIHFGAIQRVWRFAMGISGLTLLTVLNTQVDKVVLSQNLTLTSFGYYTVAWAVAGYISMLCDPIMLAFMPHMARLVSLDDKAGLVVAYHKAAQVMSIAIFPVTIFVALFAKEILAVWTKDPTVAQNAAPLVTLLICGSALQAVGSVPLALQWAYGWTAPAFWARVRNLGPADPGCLHPGLAVRSHGRSRSLAGIECRDPYDDRFYYLSTIIERQVELLAGQGPPAALSSRFCHGRDLASGRCFHGWPKPVRVSGAGRHLDIARDDAGRSSWDADFSYCLAERD